jgi:transcriptional regulator with XRE-family HTH domain
MLTPAVADLGLRPSLRMWVLLLPRDSDGSTHLTNAAGTDSTGNPRVGRSAASDQEGGLTLVDAPRHDSSVGIGIPNWAQDLRAARQAAGLTYSALARRSGLSRATLRRLERPPAGWRPTHAVATKLCTALELSPASSAALRGLCRPAPSLIARRRHTAGLTQQQVARALGISQSTVHRIETGQQLSPPRLAELLTQILPAD